ncbi:MAG: hypothetical protein AAB408_02900 [Patescibacteria group bacterium]
MPSNTGERIRTIVSAVAAGGVIGLWFLLTRLTLVWLPFVLLAVWAIFLGVAQYRIIRLHHGQFQTVPLTIFIILAATALISVIETPALIFGIMALGGGMVGHLFWLALSPQSQSSPEYKPIRRIFTIYWVFTAYGLSTATFAWHLFFPTISFIVLACLIGLWCMIATGMIWSLYFFQFSKAHLYWLLIFGFCMAEFAWIIHQLPFGYLVSGFLSSWLWYLLQLFGRFHLTPQGVLWGKQRWFLLANIVLYLLVMGFYIRWV